MDTPKKFTSVIEFCAGYGGLLLGIKRAVRGVRCIALSEIEAYAAANLVAKMEAGLLDPAPLWPNVKTFPSAEFHGLVDILCAGYPCQPFSAAGLRKGADDPRHLWPFIRTAYRAMRPRAIFLENVEGHVSLGLSTVLSDLEEDGYSATWGIFSAAEVGAPHQRKRVFILAIPTGELRDGPLLSRRGREGFTDDCCASEQLEHTPRIGWGEGRPQPAGQFGEPAAAESSLQLAHGSSPRLEGELQPGSPDSEGRQEPNHGLAPHGGGIRRLPDRWPARPGEAQHEWEAPRTTQPRLGGATNGNPSRVDRLRLLGNGVVPQTAERAFRVLGQRLGLFQ